MTCVISTSQPYTRIGGEDYISSIIQPIEPTVNSPVLNLKVEVSGPTGPSESFEVTLFAGPTAEPGNYASFGSNGTSAPDGIVFNVGSELPSGGTITFTKPGLFPKYPNSYLVGDIYIFNIPRPPYQIGGLRPDEKPVGLCLERGSRSITSIGTVTNDLLNQCNGIAVPAINVNGRTLVDNSDMGNTIFTITDKISYRREKAIPLDIKVCTLDCIPADEIVITKFEKCCPKMVSVIKGNDCTLQEKMEVFWEQTDKEIFFIPFYDNILIYGMVKYILARALYGYFDINFLLWKYNKRFLKDLSRSRFCNFVQFFQQPQFSNYQNYFLYC